MILFIIVAFAVTALLVLYIKKDTGVKSLFKRNDTITSTDNWSSLEPSDNFFSAQAAVDDLSMEIDDLHWLLERKKRDLQELKTEQSIRDEAAMKVDAMEDTIDVIEERLHKLQSNLLNVRETAITLDELNVSCQQLQNSLAHSQHQLQATLSENEALKQELEELQAYTADIKEQRKLLERKVRLLEELHTPS